MSYQPKTWENKPSTASPINATNLNHMEGGIKTNDDNITDAQNAILTLQGEMLQAQGDISALETLVDSILPVDTESGNPAVITDAFGGACKSLKLTLEPVQSGSGTPSPQNVRPISGRTQSVVTRTGKNLWSVGDLTQASASGNSINLAAGNYVVKTNSTKVLTIRFYYSDGTSLLVSNITSSNAVTFTATMPIVSANYNVPTFVTGDVIKVQLELGSTATPYEPYNGESITRTYGTTIYGGADDVTGDGLTIAYGFATYDGSDDESWTMYGTGSAGAYAIIGRLPSVAEFTPNVLGVLTANYLENISAQATWGNYDYFISQSNAMTGIDFIIGLKNISTSVNALKTYLAEHPLTVCYKLATPTFIPLTPQKVNLDAGSNTVSSDAGTTMDLKYLGTLVPGGANGRSLNRSLNLNREVIDGEKRKEIQEEIKEVPVEEPVTVKKSTKKSTK